MKQVFISYRRGSGLYMAKNIATYLSTLGYKVFFDYDSMENGVFDKQIFSAIEDSNDFILVLTENSLDNCVYPNDWVRAEILCAKKHNKNIILATDAERFKEYPYNLPQELYKIQEDFTPISNESGNFDWLIYRFYNPDVEKEIWRMSAKISETLYLNIIITTDKMNFVSERRFVVNLKRILSNNAPVFMKYIREEYS